ncbi:MAG: hypothetical protein II306_09000, partial [Clostridia bacterium]|nr:hypothetical protein [Clostridia bacterium]
MNQNQKQIIPSFDESQINEQGVVSLAIRPNQRSQYGVGNLTGKQLQERFDRLTTLTIKHLNDVIKMLNEKDILTTSDLISEISDLLTKIYNEEDGLIAKNPVSDEDTGLNGILEDLYDYIGALNTFTKISGYINEDNPDVTLDDIFATITALENHESAKDAHPEAIKQGVNAGIATHNDSEDAHKGKFLTADDVVNGFNSTETNKPLSAFMGNALHTALGNEADARSKGIKAEKEAREKAVQSCLHKQENDSGMRKAVCLKAAKGEPIAGQTGIFVQTSFNSKDPTQYESIPARGTSGSHIGTFEIAHPELDTT